MKTMQYSKKQDKLHSARNNFTPFSSLFISCQTRKGGLELFLVMKTKLALPLYRNMEVFDQPKESQALLDVFFQKILPA